MKQERIYKRDWLSILVLALTGIALVAYAWKPGMLFGSETDWFSQHLAFSQTLRENFFTHKDWFPDFLDSVGCGQNIYNFSYYGLFRPDVMIGCLLPNIEMSTIVSFYSIGLYLCGAILLYCWLRRNHSGHGGAVLAGMLFLMSSVLFQSHRQLMFVNYMPFLILSLWGIDKLVETKRTLLMSVAVFLMILHSYYFSVTGLFVCLIYFVYRKDKWSQIITFIRACAGGILASGILLVPTAIAMLSNTRGEKSIVSVVDLLIPSEQSAANLLYEPYGCGFPLFVLAMMLAGIVIRQYRGLSIALHCCFLFPMVSYVLNGTLYMRTKVFLCFLPLVLYLVAFVWETICAQLPKRKLVLAAKYGIMALAVISALCVAKSSDEREHLMNEDAYRRIAAMEGELPNTKEYRILNVDKPMQAANMITQTGHKKTTVYSSISNGLYDDFWKNTLQNTQSTRNSLALTGGRNIFSQVLLAEKYVCSNEEEPETKDVFPIAYQSDTYISEEQFHSINYPYTLDTLLMRTIRTNCEQEQDYQSQIVQLPLVIQDGECPEVIYNNDLKEIAILMFRVDTKRAKDITITVNGIAEKLSSYRSYYPNNNHLFSFVVENPGKELRIQYGKGDYVLSDYRLYTMSKQVFEGAVSRIEPVTFMKTRGKEVLHVEARGAKERCLVTSIPYDSGMRASVDGKDVPVEKVNLSFCGVDLDSGNHEVVLTYHAPGKLVGIVTSILGIAIILFNVYWGRKKEGITNEEK